MLLKRIASHLQSWLQNTANFIPFWEPFGSYSITIHRAAFPKFFVFWFVSALPLLWATLSQPMSRANESYFHVFSLNLWRSFNGTHLFIYAVSFITPIFYLAWEQYQAVEDHAKSKKRKISNLKLAPPGFGLVLFCAAIVFLLTTAMYGNSTTEQSPNKTTLLYLFSSWITIFVYVFSLCCWYLTVLGSIGAPTQDFSSALRKQEDNQKAKFSQRIANQKEDSDD